MPYKDPEQKRVAARRWYRKRRAREIAETQTLETRGAGQGAPASPLSERQRLGVAKLGMNSPHHLGKSVGICFVCGQYVPLTAYGRPVSHYPDDLSGAYRCGSYCRGATAPARRIVSRTVWSDLVT